MERRSVLPILGLWSLLVLSLCGCGGGHSTAGGGGGTGITGTTMTEQTRTAALAAIAAKYDSLPQTSATDDAASLLAFIKTRGEFTVRGSADILSGRASPTDGPRHHPERFPGHTGQAGDQIGFRCSAVALDRRGVGDTRQQQGFPGEHARDGRPGGH